MFSAKKQQLFDAKKQTSASSPFIKAAAVESSVVLSENGAKKYSTTQNAFVDQFSKVGHYKTPRSFDEISKDCEALWAENKLLAICFIIYLRIITRIVSLWDGTKTNTSAKGAGLKHEPIMRMIWLHIKSPDVFWKNIILFISVGSWKDIFTILSYDLVYNGWDERKLDWKKFGDFLLSGLDNDNQRQLILKYLPQIKANSKCTTVESQADNIIAKWICQLLHGSKNVDSPKTYAQYRRMKSSGTAHQWQQLISRREYDKIEFSKIHGRALNLLVKSKFLFNSGLSDSYSAWVTKPETKTVKFTGFVSELFSSFPTQWNGYRALGVGNILKFDANLIATVNKQFAELVAKAGEKIPTKFIVVRDTSGSMSANAVGTKISCFDIAKSLALFFSQFLSGPFANSYIEFSKQATLRQWIGETITEKWFNDNQNIVGDTNFISVIGLFCTLKQQGLAEEHFPTGILCISDGEFNPAHLNQTNVHAARQALYRAGFSSEFCYNFKIVLWNTARANAANKFESSADTPNVFYFGGYDGSVISFLTSEAQTAEDVLNEALSQEVMRYIQL